MYRGSVIIIPSEEKIEDDYFEEYIDMNHLEGFQKFSDKYNLGFKFVDYDYQEAPIRIAKDGHLVVKTIKDMDVAIKGMEEEPDRIHGYYNLTNILRERSKLYIEKEGERNVR